MRDFELFIVHTREGFIQHVAIMLNHGQEATKDRQKNWSGAAPRRAARARRARRARRLGQFCFFVAFSSPVWYPGARSDISGRRHRPCRGYFEVTSPSPPLFSHLSSTPCAFSPLFPYHISLCLSGASRRAVTCLTLATAGALPVAVNFNIAAPLLASSCTR